MFLCMIAAWGGMGFSGAFLGCDILNRQTAVSKIALTQYDRIQAAACINSTQTAGKIWNQVGWSRIERVYFGGRSVSRYFAARVVERVHARLAR